MSALRRGAESSLEVCCVTVETSFAAGRAEGNAQILGCDTCGLSGSPAHSAEDGAEAL